MRPSRLSAVLLSGLPIYVVSQDGRRYFVSLQSAYDCSDTKPPLAKNAEEFLYLRWCSKQPDMSLAAHLRMASGTMMFQMVYFLKDIPEDAVQVGLDKTRTKVVEWSSRWVDGFDVHRAIQILGCSRDLHQIAGSLGLNVDAAKVCVDEAVAGGFVCFDESAGAYWAA